MSPFHVKPFGQWGFNPDGTSRLRMREFNTVSVEAHPPQRIIARSIDWIADDRAPRVSELDSDLMLATGQQLHFDQTITTVLV